MSRPGIATARVAGIVIAGCLCLMAVAQARTSRQDSPARSERPEAPPQRDAEQGGRRAGGPGRRELSEEDVQRIIATARDIDPEWGDALERLKGLDAGELRQRIGMQARRLMGLAWLRDRQPELYRSRVEDFRAQRDARRAVEAIRKAKESGDAVAEAEALAQAREAISRLFPAFFNDPSRMPPEWAAQAAERTGAARAVVVADYIAGMTDRYALGEVERLAGDGALRRG